MANSKKFVANVVINHLKPIQERYNSLINSEELDRILDEGINLSRKISKEKFELIKEKIGTVRWLKGKFWRKKFSFFVDKKFTRLLTLVGEYFMIKVL